MSNWCITPNNNDLVHHGIKGQQWGIRNGPPYPIEDKVLKKGYRVNSVSGYKKSKSYLNSSQKKYLKGQLRRGRAIRILHIANLNPIAAIRLGKILKEIKKNINNSKKLSEEVLNKLYVYNPEDEHDSKVYKGPFSYYLTMARGYNAVYEHRFETLRDLSMPNSTERFSAFKDLMSQNKTEYGKELNDAYDLLLSQNQAYAINMEKRRKTKFDATNLKTKSDYRDAYSIFNAAMINPSGSKVTRDYLNKMAKNYDAMVDDNNVKVYNDAHDPIIIFNANKNLKYITEKAQRIPFKSIEESLTEIDEYMKKNGKSGAML